MQLSHHSLCTNKFALLAKPKNMLTQSIVQMKGNILAHAIKIFSHGSRSKVRNKSTTFTSHKTV